MRRFWAGFGLPLLSKELAEMAQLRRTYLVRVAFAVLIFSTSVFFILPTYWAFHRSPARLMGHGAHVLDLLYALEWVGLVLFVPAIVSGALTAEKERNTLQLLFLTKLGPWTILFEKLLSRLVPVATFLLVSLPLLFIAYLLGGLTQTDLTLAASGLILTAFELASIAIFCSAFCATSASAFILSYVLTALVFLFPFLALLTLFFFNWCSVKFGAGQIGLYLLREYSGALEGLRMATVGINLGWIDQGFGPGAGRPFPTALPPFLVISAIGVLFLFMARAVVEDRASPQPRHHIRRLYAWLDRAFTNLNDRYAKGIRFAQPDSGLPEANPVIWRENRRGNLGRVNHLVRAVVLLESPLLIVSALSAGFVHDKNFSTLGTVGLCLWPIALLIVIVRSAGLFAAEKARQTLDVLLTTPLSLSELVGDKMRGLWRMMTVVAVPIVFQTLLIAFLRLAVSDTIETDEGRQSLKTGGEALLFLVVIGLNLAILFWLAAQLAFLFGLSARTQGRAVIYAVSLFAGLCFLPLLVRFAVREEWAWDQLYLCPIAGILVSEFPRIGAAWQGQPDPWLPGPPVWQFHPLLHCGFYGGIVVALAAINWHLAGKTLLRPD